MKITKLVHSCVVVEQDSKKLIVDPGNYSWQSGVVKPELLIGIDSVVVTHIHPDHLDKEFVGAITQKSPDAKWYGPSEVVGQLESWGIKASSSSEDSTIKFVESAHADLSPWFPSQPEHTSFVLFGDLLIGGDCHTLSSSHGARIFGAAVSGGPWGAVVGFSKMIEAMRDRPEVVIPLHDWHLNEEARSGFYAKLPSVLEPFGVEFVALENGVSKSI